MVDGPCIALGVVESEAIVDAGPELQLGKDAHLPLRAHLTGEVELRHDQKGLVALSLRRYRLRILRWR